VNYPSFLFV